MAAACPGLALAPAGCHVWLDFQATRVGNVCDEWPTTESYATHSDTGAGCQSEVSETLRFPFCACHLPAQTEHYYNRGFLMFQEKLYENKPVLSVFKTQSKTPLGDRPVRGKRTHVRAGRRPLTLNLVGAFSTRRK